MVDGYLACLMMSRADSSCYMSLKNKLDNSMLLGSDNCPKSREELLQVFNYYKDEEVKRGLSATRAEQEEVAFLQQGGSNKKKQHYGPRTNINGRSGFSHCKKTDC